MFMGIGNLRIMRLFKKARKMSRKYGGAVIFLDELDAVGGTRGAVSNTSAPADTGRHWLAKGPLRIIMGGMGMGGGGMYVNELLVQMDGMIMPNGLWRHVKRWLHLGKPKMPSVQHPGHRGHQPGLDPRPGAAAARAGSTARSTSACPRRPGREDILAVLPGQGAATSRSTSRGWPQGDRRLLSPAQIKNLVNEALIFALATGATQLNFDDLWHGQGDRGDRPQGGDQDLGPETAR